MLEQHVGCWLGLGLDLRECAGHLGSVSIELADKTAADFHVLPVCLDRVVDFGCDIGALDGCGFGLDAIDTLVEVVEGGGEGSVRCGGEVPDKVEGGAICIEGALPVSGEAGLCKCGWGQGKGGDGGQ